jgi:ABC-2 type transport system permease protein
MSEIFLHQLQDNLKSLRFQISLLVLLFFFVGNGVVYTWRMERLTKEIAQWNTINEDRYRTVNSLNQAAGRRYECLNYPLGTEFIAEGGFDWFPDATSFTPQTGGDAPRSGKALATNHWMGPFEVVDWTLVARLVLSFLCIVLAYNAISGEMENGTLRLVLSNPLSRGSFLAGKFLAQMVLLLVATLIGTLISLLILSLNGVIELNARVLQGYWMFLLGTTIYITFFLFLSIGISALVRSSASSLVLLVLVWAVFSVVIPQTSYLLGVRAVKSPSVTFDSRQRELMEETIRYLEKEGLWPRGRELGSADDYAVEKRYAQRMRDTEREMDQIARVFDNQTLQQYKIVKTMNLLSPGLAFQYTIEAFLRTGEMRYEHFINQVWRYRDILRDFIRTIDASDLDSPHILFLPGYMSKKDIDSNHLPRFKEKPPSLADGMAAGVIPIVILVIEAGLAFFFAFWAFNRAEITG